MPKISNILGRNERKLDLSKFFPDDEGGAYIYIRKLTPIIKKKIKLLSLKSLSDPGRRDMMKDLMTRSDLLKDKEALDKLTDKEKYDLVVELELDTKFDAGMMEIVDEKEQIVMNAGIHPEKHNFVGEDDKPVELTYNALSQFCDEDCLKYIYTEIETLSDGISLEK